MGRRKHRSQAKKGSQSASKTDSGHKKKGPGGGLGIPPAPENPQQQEGEVHREPQVITQEHQQQQHPAGLPPSLVSTSPPSGSPAHSPSKECDTSSVGEDTNTTSSTNYSSCIEATTPSEETPLPSTSVGGQIHESTANSASDTVAQNSSRNGAEKDSEYESAEEVDLPPDPAPSGNLQPVSSEKSPTCEASESENNRREVNVGSDAFPGDQQKLITDPREDIVLQKEVVLPQASEILDNTGDKPSIPLGTEDVVDCQPSSVIVDSDSHSVPQEQSESLPSIISDSVVTVTKSEIIEESVRNKEVLIDECVTISPNDIQLLEKVSEVVSPESQCIENNVGPNVATPEASNISVCNVQHQTDCQVGEVVASSQNISVSREGDHKSEVQSDGEVQDRSYESHSDIQADSLLGRTVDQLEPSVTPQGTGEKDKSPLEQPVTQGDAPEPQGPSEKEGIEELQPAQRPEDPDDIPIPPSKGYNLDFLDNLDDPNFNPFATKTGVRSTPPPSPDPARKLPPLKPAVRKKDKKTAPADRTCNVVNKETEKNAESEAGTDKRLVGEIDKVAVVSPAADNATNNNSEKVVEAGKALEIALDNPVKPPRKLGVKPNLANRQKTGAKTPPAHKGIEKNNNNTVAEEKAPNQENKADSEELPLPPSKGYNLDFLDNLDDPNFDPFATKTAVGNSPPKGDFTTVNNKEEEPKPKVVAAKKTPAKKGFVPLKSKAKTPGSDTDSKSISTKLEDNKIVSEPATGKQVDSSREEDDEIVPPSKGYNLDFLDDPSFDPFKTRSSVIQQDSGSPKPSGVQENSSNVVKQQSIGSSKGNSNLELDVNENIDVEKDCGIQREKNNKTVDASETDFGKKLVDVCDLSDKVDAEVKTEGTLDVNDNSQQSDDAEETTNSETKSIEKEAERKRTYTLPEQEQLNVLENLESGQQKVDSEADKTLAVKDLSVISVPDENVHKVPSIGTIGQLDSLEFDQLLGHEASRLAEEFMNCSTDSGLPDSDESTPVKSVNSVMADTSCANTNLDENVNPFQKSSRLSRSPPLGKRGAVCGAESSDAVSRADPFMTRRSLKRESVLGEERMETRSMDDDSGIVLGTRSDLEETDANHSEAGPEIATGLTSSDLRCASQFFKEATDLENQLRKTLVSPLLGSHSKLSSEEGTPTKERKDPAPSITPESPQNKPVPSTSSPAPPPREERSAPEGTSSPTPRPVDTSERKLSSTRPTSAPPEGYMTATEVQELLKRQERKFEEKLLQVELAAGEKEKKLQQAMKDEQKERASLGNSVSDLTQSRDALLKMVGQYKGMLASLVSEKEKEKQVSDEKIKTLETERNQALEDLANVEVAFSDVHRKYERTKQVVDTLRRNEETLRGAVADYETKLQKQEQKFVEFQKHAEEKIQLANEEFENMRRANEQEMTKMAALLKKAEMKIMSLQDAHDRKVRENQELTQLCDDLINKVGK